MSTERFAANLRVRRDGVARFVRVLIDDLRILMRGLQLVIRPAPFVSVVFLVLGAFIALTQVSQVLLAKLVVDSLADNSATAAVTFAILYGLTLIVPAGVGRIQEAITSSLEPRAVAEVDYALIGNSARLVDLDHIERPSYQDEVRLLQQNAYWAPRLFNYFQHWPVGILTLVGVLVLLSGLHPLIPLALALTGGLSLTVRRNQNLRFWEAVQKRNRLEREMDYCIEVATQPDAAKEVRVFGLGDFLVRRFRQRSELVLADTTRLHLVHLRTSALFGGLSALALAGGFWYVATQAGAGRLTLGDVALYFNAVIQAQYQFEMLVQGTNYIHETYLRLRALFKFTDEAQPAIKLARSGEGRPAPDAARYDIELRDLGFAYPNSDLPVLSGVGARLPAGTVTAIVGANGAGKSTLVKLLTRMYDPDQGQILLDGIPLAEYDLESLRRSIAVVYQDFAQFALTFGENVAVGAAVPGQMSSRIEEAARWAGADEIAARLPAGYETQLTRRFEGGVELSGGEWQKVGLARGFVRDAGLVILDEPTAALDAEAEYQLFQRFREIVIGKTALLISHRFSTVRMADQILVLEDGRIIEAGGHDELVEMGGRYAALYEMQAGRYR